MEFSHIDIAIFVFSFAIAGIVKGVIGLGLPTIAMGLLSFRMAPAQAAAILLIPALLTNVWQIYRGPALSSVLQRIWLMLLFTIAGTMLSASVITSTNTKITIAILGSVLITYSIAGFFGQRFPVQRAHEAPLGVLVGLTTGILNGATGVFVFPGLPYLQGLEMKKDLFIQAIATSALVSTVALGAGLGLNGALSIDVVGPSIIATCTALAGMTAGRTVRSKLSLLAFQRCVFVGLLAMGVSMIARTF